MLIQKFIIGPFEVNSFLIIEEQTNHTIIVDPGHSPFELIEYIEAKGLIPQYIINTHGHVDHIGGNSDIVNKYDIPIYIGKQDAEMLTDASMNLSSFMNEPVISPPAGKIVGENDILSLGDDTIKIIETPGHTPGSISLLTGSNVICGDVLFFESIGRTDFPRGNYETLIRSIKNKLFSLPDHTVVFSGHGPETEIGHEKKMNPYLR